MFLRALFDALATPMPQITLTMASPSFVGLLLIPPRIWLVLHVLESIGNSPDRDDVGELSLRGLLPSVDAHPTHRAGYQAKKEKKVKEQS